MALKNKLLLLLSISALLLTLNASANSKNRGAYATKNIEGQNHYLKRCSTCHGEGNRGGNMASISEWKELFANKAMELKDLHSDDTESVDVVLYFESKDFKKESEIMMKFLQEFAYDSDNIPTCN